MYKIQKLKNSKFQMKDITILHHHQMDYYVLLLILNLKKVILYFSIYILAEYVHIFTLNTQTQKNLIITIKTDNFRAFYYYWSPNSKYLSFLGNVENQVGLYVINVNEIILQNSQGNNSLEYLENNGPVLINGLPNLLLKGRPLFYQWIDEKIYYHISNKKIGIIENFKDVKEIQPKHKLGSYGTPIVLKNGNLIIMIETQNDYECVLISQNGDILKKYFLFDKEKTEDPIFNLILSPSENFFAVGVSNSNGITYTILIYDLKNQMEKKIPSDLFLIYLFNDKDQLLVLTSNKMKMFTISQTIEIQKYSIKGLTQDFGMVVRYFDQYLHSTKFYSGEYFLFGSNSPQLQPLIFIKNIEKEEQEIIIDEGSFGCFIPK